jgi:hypothetical protein
VAAVAGDEVAEAETETWSNFVEVDAPGAVQWVRVTADVILAAECDSGSRGGDGRARIRLLLPNTSCRLRRKCPPKGNQSRAVWPERRRKLTPTFAPCSWKLVA